MPTAKIRVLAVTAGLILSCCTIAGAATPVPARLAFTSYQQGFQLFSMDSAGGDVRRVSTSYAVEHQGVPSRDGTKIAFVSERDGNPELYVMNADGSGARRLTNHPALDQSPDWSPDSQRITFESYRDDGDGDIFVVNVDGSGLTKVAGSADEDNN